ncbi:MAG: LicD family protein [Erysipelotrichaceae bacterium]
MEQNNTFIIKKDSYVIHTTNDGETITMDRLHTHILSIMDEIHRICIKHNIHYGLIAGSALGMVNYGGFIPWDDDIDMCVLREDWTKFIEVLKSDLSDEFYFHCFETDQRYNILIPNMKIRKRNTYVEETNGFLRNTCDGDGVFVDVIIYDNIAENKWIDELNRTLIKILMLIIVPLENFKLNPIRLKTFVHKYAFRYGDKHKDSTLMSQHISIPWEKFLREPVFKKSDILPFKLYLFEGREYYSYQNIETVLGQWFGLNCFKKWVNDHYEETLPVEKRKPKHIIDLNLNGNTSIKKQVDLK